jgi:hypothetical protein
VVSLRGDLFLGPTKKIVRKKFKKKKGGKKVQKNQKFEEGEKTRGNLGRIIVVVKGAPYLLLRLGVSKRKEANKKDDDDRATTTTTTLARR